MIDTPRLLLRPPDESDVEAWAAMLSDPDVARYLGPPVDSREAVVAHIRTVRERHESDGFGLLTVVRREDGRVIGRSAFLVWDRRTWAPTTRVEAGKDAEVEIGWTLARDCWGFGYATEAGEACRDYGFAQLGLDRVAAVIQHGNERSIAVARRLGMRHQQDIRTAKGFAAEVWIARAAGLVADAPIAVVRYDTEWPRLFDAERVVLERVLAPWSKGGIHHVGSTAVPGLASKPIIDMIAGVHDLDEAQAALAPLRKHSYVPSPHRAEIAHHFDKPSTRLSEVRYGLHLTEPGSDLWRERLAFRDALRNSSQLASEYEALKLRLADAHRDDIEAYTAGKRAFVARVLASGGIQLGPG